MNLSALTKSTLLMVIGCFGILASTVNAQELYRPVQFAGDHSLVFHPNTPLGSDTLGTIELLFRASPVPKKPPKIRRSNNSSISNGGIFGGLFGRPPRQFSEDAPSPSPPNTSVRPEKNTDTLGTMAVFSQADSRNTRFTVFLNQSLSRIGLYNGSTFQSVTFDFNDGKFHHVLFVTQAGATQVIIDGEAVGDPLEFTFGAGRQMPLHVGSADGNLHVFKGEVYVVRMWSTAVTVDDIPRLRTYGAPPKTDPLSPSLLLYSEFTQSRQDLILGQDIIYRTDLLGVKGETVFTHLLTDSTRYIGIMNSTDSLCMPGIQFTVAGISPEQDTTFITFPSGIAFQASDSVNVFDMAMNEYLTGVHGTFDGTCIRTLRFSTNLRNSDLRPQLVIPEITASFEDTVAVFGTQKSYRTKSDALLGDTVATYLDMFVPRVSAPTTGPESGNARIPEGTHLVGVEVEANGDQMVGIRFLYKKTYTLENLDLGVWQARGTGEPVRDDDLALRNNHVDGRDGNIHLHGTYTSDPLYRLSMNLGAKELTLSGEIPPIFPSHPQYDTLLIEPSHVDTLSIDTTFASDGSISQIDTTYGFASGSIEYQNTRLNSLERNTLGPYVFETEDGISYTLASTGITLEFLNSSQYQLTVPDSSAAFPIKSGIYEYIPSYQSPSSDKIAWGGTFSLEQRPVLVEHNFKGYNIAKMNSINYQLGTGTSKMVFAYPEEDSYDYYYSSVGKIVPYGLFYKNDREAMARARAHNAASEQSYQKTWGVNLGFNVGVEGMGFGLNSSHQHEVQTMERTANMFSYAIAHEVKYAMVLDKARMRLDPEFEAAIYELRDEWLSRGYASPMDSITKYYPNYAFRPDVSTAADRALINLTPDTIRTSEGHFKKFTVFDLTFEASLRHFIETYGTHYPYAVSYGGMAYQKTQYSSKELDSAFNYNLDLSAEAQGNLEGVAAGFSLGTSWGEGAGAVASEDDRITNLYAIGGEISVGADGGSWSLPDHEEVPVFLDLRPISDLFSPIYFEDTVVWQQLREAMESALDGYQQSLPAPSPTLWDPDSLVESYQVEILRLDSLKLPSRTERATTNKYSVATGAVGEWTGTFTITTNNPNNLRYSANNAIPFNYTGIGDGTGIPYGGTIHLPTDKPVIYNLLSSQDTGQVMIAIDLHNQYITENGNTCQASIDIPVTDFSFEWHTGSLTVVEKDDDGETPDNPNSALVTYRYRRIESHSFDDGDN